MKRSIVIFVQCLLLVLWISMHSSSIAESTKLNHTKKIAKITWYCAEIFAVSMFAGWVYHDLKHRLCAPDTWAFSIAEISLLLHGGSGLIEELALIEHVQKLYKKYISNKKASENDQKIIAKINDYCAY